ncbi:hypothetical protein SK128_026726 [Halocaridina rubra]|uniref:C2H2-type domain-containing protein n=1 Tax=Halocaridina rubra TaxID=373956 RepID=A0AAN8XDS2_HALRR
MMSHELYKGIVAQDSSSVHHSLYSGMLRRGSLERESSSFVKNNPSFSKECPMTSELRMRREGRKIKLKSLHYVCNVSSCGEKFSGSDQLDTHMKLHLGVKPFVCNCCGKVCLTESKLKAHEATHANDGVKPVCDVCQRSFSSRSSLNKHKKMLHKPKPHICPQCNFGLEERKYLVIHAKRAHNLDLPLEMESINLLDADADNTNASSQEPSTDNHNEKSKESLLYDSHSTSLNFGTHDILVENLPKNCSDVFKRETGTENSAKVDLLAPIKCSQCTSTFPSQTYLQQHMAVHESEKLFSCLCCCLKFSNEKDLTCHMKSHSFGNETNFPSYISPNQCKDSKIGEKYACVPCKKYFANLGSLKRHQSKDHYSMEFKLL